MKKKNPKKKKDPKKELKKQADHLWHQAVIEKYGNRCFFINSSKKAKNCLGTTQICHHIKKKSGYAHLRYHIKNGVPVCWPCHFKLENYDLSMTVDIVLKRGKKWYSELEEKAKEKQKSSYKTIEYYKDNIKRLERFIINNKKNYDK